MRYALRSKISASAPAGIDRKNIGSTVEAWTSATMSGLGSRVTISQPAPTSCIHVPRLDTSVASHNARKSGRRKGAHAEA
jgi:hypothetical protein